MLDFYAWHRLSVNEPKIYDILRRKLLDREVRKYAKNAVDLWIKRGWWTRVELEMGTHKGAVGRIVAACKKMRESFTELNDKLQGFKK